MCLLVHPFQNDLYNSNIKVGVPLATTIVKVLAPEFRVTPVVYSDPPPCDPFAVVEKAKG